MGAPGSSIRRRSGCICKSAVDSTSVISRHRFYACELTSTEDPSPKVATLSQPTSLHAEARQLRRHHYGERVLFLKVIIGRHAVKAVRMNQCAHRMRPEEVSAHIENSQRKDGPACRSDEMDYPSPGTMARCTLLPSALLTGCNDRGLGPTCRALASKIEHR